MQFGVVLDVGERMSISYFISCLFLIGIVAAVIAGKTVTKSCLITFVAHDKPPVRVAPKSEVDIDIVSINLFVSDDNASHSDSYFNSYSNSKPLSKPFVSSLKSSKSCDFNPHIRAKTIEMDKINIIGDVCGDTDDRCSVSSAAALALVQESFQSLSNEQLPASIPISFLFVSR